jgi:hypothetical protein
MRVATRFWATLFVAVVWVAACMTVASGPAANLAIAPKVSGAAACLRP